MAAEQNYVARRDAFIARMPELVGDAAWRAEFLFETLADESLFGDIDDTRRWYAVCVEANKMAAARIPLADCRGWSLDVEGSLVHDSGEFFRVDGIRVTTSPTREVSGGWDQPILTQIGYDGGILGLLRRRFDGVPHYLVEAKAEPGNYKLVQITSTIQATFSNLKRAHGGGRTRFAEYFLDPAGNGATVLLDSWMSEDGGRLFNKRNRTMLVELPEDSHLPDLPSTYRWVSLYQLKTLLRTEDAAVAPHVRGVLALV